jgi:hypothetical protein
MSALLLLTVVSELILKNLKVKMNFENYVNALVQGRDVKLVGWPEGVEFKRMSLQSSIGPLRRLHDALKAGTCRWKIFRRTKWRSL